MLPVGNALQFEQGVCGLSWGARGWSTCLPRCFHHPPWGPRTVRTKAVDVYRTQAAPQAFVVNFLGCLWVFIASIEGFDESWMAAVTTGTEEAPLDLASGPTQWLAAAYFATTTVLTIGYGDITPRQVIIISSPCVQREGARRGCRRRRGVATEELGNPPVLGSMLAAESIGLLGLQGPISIGVRSGIEVLPPLV